ncbi:unnamed protein product [Leptosia nina]|uniref:RRM domain-containing protein n=1 Tax=Leptosia nina TaxID=320188 RepID=A0AAV1J1S1_9NEOP
MFFENVDDENFNHEVFQVMSREIYAITATSHYNRVRSAPTHTEDGIPIRKLYVSNLPAKTTRSELFGIFAPYGFIKSCWLRMGDRGPNRTPTPAYAFITYSNPADAHKALIAPHYEKQLRGVILRIFPADSWHQPVEDSEGRVCWRPNGERLDANSYLSSAEAGQKPEEVASPVVGGAENSNVVCTSQDSEKEENDPCNILNILNTDCLSHILSFVPIKDLIRSERVSKKWQDMIAEHLMSIRTFKTSTWRDNRLTTAILRRVLQRFGSSLLRLHIDDNWSALNDRTAHTIGKFCPNLEELKVVGMLTKNWNPLIYGCKELKDISFLSCTKLTDSSLVQVARGDIAVEKITIANNTHVTGLFLTATHPLQLTSIVFYNCYSLQGTVLCAAMDALPNLTTLHLDLCPLTLWKIIHLILKKVPKLEDLSLSDYTSMEVSYKLNGIEPFCEAIGTLTELKRLNLSKNINITNSVLKQVAQSCQKLESLNVSYCDSKRFPGVSDEGIIAICSSCPLISDLDISHLAGLTNAGCKAASKLKQLQSITSRGNSALSSAPFNAIINTCHSLKEIDVCGSTGVTEDVFTNVKRSLDKYPRNFKIFLADTAADCPGVEIIEELAKYKLLNVDFHNNRSDPPVCPNFVDIIIDDSSDESYDDVYEHEFYNDLMGQMLSSDDELLLDEMEYDREAELFHNAFLLF